MSVYFSTDWESHSIDHIKQRGRDECFPSKNVLPGVIVVFPGETLTVIYGIMQQSVSLWESISNRTIFLEASVRTIYLEHP